MSEHVQLADYIKKNFDEAYSRARKLGELIGVVSRRNPSIISEEGDRVLIEVDPATYYRSGDSVSVGNYLVCVDIRTLKTVGLKVVGLHRVDAISDIQVPSAITLDPDIEGLMTNVVVEATPLLAETGEPFTYAVEPQSPVILPKDKDVLTKVIGLPSEGVPIGFLHTGSVPVANGGVTVKLPYVEFFKHMLIIGTTGSGKTTFIKNLIYFVHRLWRDAMVVIIDAAGDYTQVAIPPLTQPEDSELMVSNYGELIDTYPRWLTVLVPLRRGVGSVMDFVKSYVNERLVRVTKAYYGLDPEVSIKVPGRDYGTIKSAMVGVKLGSYVATVELIPVSLSYHQLKDHLEILPLFSRQAKVYLRNAISYLESEAGSILNFTHLYRVFQEKSDDLMKIMKLHRGTLENIERVLNFIASSEEVDVAIGRKIVGMPPVDRLAVNYKGPIVLDLDYAAMRGAHFLILNMIAYEFLRTFYVWKKVGSGIARPVLFVLDEAHRFFPSEGTTSEEVEVLADFISRIARLGRSRGLGLIFSTHSPKDVHKIVIQLANTKVLFRSEKEYLDMLDVPKEYVRLLELAPDRVALLRTSTIRSGYALLKTPGPLLSHYDLGRALIRRAEEPG